MKRLSRPRHSLWLVLVLVIVGLATVAAVAVAGLRPADLTFTPKSERDSDEHRRCSRVGQELLRRADGRCRHRRDRDVGDALEPRQQLRARGASMSPRMANDWLEHKRSGRSGRTRRRSWSTSTTRRLPPGTTSSTATGTSTRRTNASFVGLTGTTFTGNMFPATPGMVDTGQPRQGPGLCRLLDYRAGRFAARGDDRQPGG